MIMRKEDADIVFDEIVKFVTSCGGHYERITDISQKNIYYSIVTGNYCYIPGQAFFCWKMIAESEIEKIQTTDAMELLPGEVVCVLENASKSGKGCRTIKEVLKRIYRGKPSKIVWNHAGKGIRVFAPRSYCHA